MYAFLPRHVLLELTVNLLLHSDGEDLPETGTRTNVERSGEGSAPDGSGNGCEIGLGSNGHGSGIGSKGGNDSSRSA